MRSADNNTISVEITRMGADVTTVSVPEDSTLSDVLAKAGITLGSAETAWVGGDEATANDIIDDGDTVQLVGKKEGGLK